MPAVGEIVHRVLLHAIEGLQARLELLQIELAAEQARLGRQLLRSLVLVLLIFLAVQTSGLLLVALAWNTPWRIPVIAGLATVMALAALQLGRRLQRRGESGAFAATVAELGKDLSLLRKP